MGNYGQTMDYWYRRAVIVLWPASLNTIMNFKLNYASALQELLSLSSFCGNEEKVINLINLSLI